jgi:hypothetical protein
MGKQKKKNKKKSAKNGAADTVTVEISAEGQPFIRKSITDVAEAAGVVWPPDPIPARSKTTVAYYDEAMIRTFVPFCTNVLTNDNVASLPLLLSGGAAAAARSPARAARRE